MEVRVHGKGLNIGERLMAYAEKKVSRAARFFDHAGDADVEIIEDSHQRNSADRFVVKISAPVAGHIVRAEGNGESAFAAIDKSADRFGRNLKRLHDRLVDRSRRGSKKDLNLTSQLAEEDSAEGIEIVRVKQFVMKPMTPEDAALQMEQLGHNFFFFLNAETDKQSVLYRRRDGRLGLIEPV